jgi:hypothetical protein
VRRRILSGAFLLRAEQTVEQVLIQPAWVEVPGATEVEARGAIVVEAPGAIVAEGAVAVDTEDELRSAGLVQVCSAVQGEPEAVVGVGQDGFGVVAGLVAPEAGPAWFRAGWVVPAARQVWFRVEWVAPVVEPGESRAVWGGLAGRLAGRGDYFRRGDYLADRRLAGRAALQAGRGVRVALPAGQGERAGRQVGQDG